MTEEELEEHFKKFMRTMYPEIHDDMFDFKDDNGFYKFETSPEPTKQMDSYAKIYKIHSRIKRIYHI
jgi:hypothetical protein